MQVNRDVILDLLPLVLAGEARPSTRSLVEEWLERDPELAALARRADDGPLAPPAPPPAAALELRALGRTRRLLGLRSGLLGAAIFASLLPFSVRGGEDGVTFLWTSYPTLAAAAAALGFGLWLAWGTLRWRLRTTGL